MMPAQALPPIGSYAVEREPKDARRRDVYKIVAIRGRVNTSVGALVSPPPVITIEHVVHKTRTHMTIAIFNQAYSWDYAQ